MFFGMEMTNKRARQVMLTLEAFIKDINGF